MRIRPAFIALALFTSPAFAQQGDRADHVMTPPPEAWNLPAPALSPEQALQSFQFGETGFALELVAGDRFLKNPVALAFDGNGRPWVCEMRGYMPNVDGTDEDIPNGRISILLDHDGDGQADEAVVFLDELVLPRTIQFVRGGILWADQSTLHFTERTGPGGLTAGATTVIDPEWAPSGNVEHKTNGLIHNLDNWFYNAKSQYRYRLLDGKWVKDKTETRGQWGIAQDDYGRLVTNSNSTLLTMETIPPGYTVRNPHHRFANRTTVGMDNSVHPIRITCGVNRGYMQGTLDERGYLAKATGSCGLTLYRGDNFPEAFYGNAFIPEPTGLLLKRAILTETDGRITAAAAYPDKEFLASTDERNRFVNSYTAPDGTLYLIDMYHGIIQHRTYVTTYLRNQILKRGLDQDNDGGRIYRVRWSAKPRGEAPRMEEENSAALVAHLSHPNGWWRDTAQRLIVERGDEDALPALETLLNDERADPRARIHATWCLEGLGALTAAHLAAVTRSENPQVIANACRAAESLAGTTEEAAAAQLLAGIKPGPAVVNRHLAAALGLFRGENKETAQNALAGLLQTDAGKDDPLVADLAMSGLHGAEWDMTQRALDDNLPLLRQLIPAVVASGDTEALQTLITRLTSDPQQRPHLQATAQAVVSRRQAKGVSALLVHAAEHPDTKEAIHAGMIRGAKTKGYKKIRLPAGTVVENPDLARIFDLSGKAPVNHLASAGARELHQLGQAEYAKLCVACHHPNGQGMVAMAPPLVDSEWVTGPEQRLIALVMEGMMGPVTVNGTLYQAPQIQPVMPGLRLNPELDDRELAGILTYVRNAWGNSAPAIQPDAVKAWRESQPPRAPYGEAELKQIK